MLTARTGRQQEQQCYSIDVFSGVDGTSNSVLISAKSSLEQVLDDIANVLRTARQDIIILYGPPYKNLDPRKNFATDLHGKDVYCFSRYTLRKHAPMPDPVRLPQLLPLPDSPDIDLEDVAEECLHSEHNPQSFQSFQIQSLHNLSLCEVLCTRAELLLQPCRTCNNESRVLLRALAAAHNNLDKHNSIMSASLEKFSTTFTRAQYEHGHVIDEFTKDLEKLGSIQLHATLRSEKRQTLLDCVPVDRLQTRCTQCRRYGRKLQSMMQELQGLARATIAAVQLELKKKAPLEVDIDTLERQALQDGPALGRQQRDVVVELGAGYRRMQTALETGTRDKFGREFVHELKESCQKQNHLVEKCREIDRELQCFGQRAAFAKSTVQHFTHKRMRSVSVLQSRIREQGKRMSALREALEQQFLAMRELQHVKKMPKAYFKSLVEVVQRHAFQKGYRAQVDSVAETMAQMHEKEVSRRELFMKEHGQHLPKDLIPGLSNQLHPCEIRARSSNESLPLIENVSEPDFLPSRSGFLDSSGENSTSSVLVPASGVWTDNMGVDHARQARLITLECENAKLHAKLMSVQMQSTDATNNHSSTSSTSSENSTCFTATAAPDHKDSNRDCSSSSSSVAGSMRSTGTARAGIEENVGSKEAIAERVVELQNSLRAEKAANIMHQKRIEELERRLCLHTRTHGAAPSTTPSSGDVEAQDITISQLTEQRLRCREGLRQVASILKEGLDVSLISDSEADCSTYSLIRSAVQSAKASVARRGNQKFQHLCASIPITASEQKLAAADPVSVFVQKYRLLEGKLQITQQELSQAHEDARQIRLSAESRICFEQFTVGCVALFIRTSGKANSNTNSIYVAFHRACPRRFLSAESIEQCRRGADPSFILGRVIFIEPKVADDDTIFPVPVGETYYLLTAALVDNT